MAFENKSEPVAPVKRFQRRLFRHVIYGAVLITFSLGIGTAGYCYFGKMSIVDGFFNASMILTGMGPVDTDVSDAGKLFASFYALYSGVAFLSAVTVTLAPIVHRFLHLMHVDESDD